MLILLFFVFVIEWCLLCGWCCVVFLGEFMMVIVVVNLKGGVGKSMLFINLVGYFVV